MKIQLTKEIDLLYHTLLQEIYYEKNDTIRQLGFNQNQKKRLQFSLFLV